MTEQTRSAYAPPIAAATRYRAPTPRLYWLGVLVACAVAIVGPALVTDGRLGLPTFRGAEGVFMFLTFLGYCVVLAAYAVFGMLFVAGRRVPAALLLGMAMFPAGAGVIGALRMIAAREDVAGAGAEAESDMLGFLARLAYPVASFGFAASGCALLVVVALTGLAHRSALVQRTLNLHEGETARATGAVVVGTCVGVLALFVHSDVGNPRANAVVATCVLAAIGAGVMAQRMRVLAVVADDQERGWLWRRAALLPVSSALAVVCFEGAVFFGGRDSLAATPVLAGLLLAATAAPMLLAVAARRAARRTVGVAFLATSVVIVVSLALLVVGGNQIVAARAAGTDHAWLDRLRKSEPMPTKGPANPDWPY
jgi:hypothetical protein